jgi:5-methyltetrahydrofolate--homocysteine methyltransferase
MNGRVGLQLVSAGDAVRQVLADFQSSGQYRELLELNGVFAGLTEALAQWTHSRVRLALGIGEGVGQRFSLGYPPCPELADRVKIHSILGAERIGVTLTEDFLSVPEFSTDAFVVTDSNATYFIP